MSTEAGNAAADASIQALGGYGYTHEYMVEKISRDVRITRIYEGTSEIMEMTISRDRWQLHLKTRGQHYHERARSRLRRCTLRIRMSARTWPPWLCTRWLRSWRKRASARLTRFQHILFRIGEVDRLRRMRCHAGAARRACG